MTDDVDTRAITRRLREDGSLIGVLSTESSRTDKELLEMSRTWDIVGRSILTWEGIDKHFNGCLYIQIYNFSGVDLISNVSCKSPYEWVDKTGSEWDFNSDGRTKEAFHVSIVMTRDCKT